MILIPRNGHDGRYKKMNQLLKEENGHGTEAPTDEYIVVKTK